MGRRLSYIILSIVIITVFSTSTATASQNYEADSFFSFLKNYLIAFTEIEQYNNRVLAAHTSGAATEITTQTQLPTPIPTHPPVQQAPSLSDVSAYILSGVNEYRASLGLPSVQASEQTCAFAAIRAQEIAGNFSHDAFYTRVNNHTIPYTTWAHATENIAEAPDYKEVVTLWENSPPHAANMRDNTPYVCIIQNGNYYAYEGMRP